METKKPQVRCECEQVEIKESDVDAMRSILSAPSFEDTIAIVGAANKAFYGMNPFPDRSPYQTKPCGGCEGKGYVFLANGPDDAEKVECGGCNGTGRVVAND